MDHSSLAVHLSDVPTVPPSESRSPAVVYVAGLAPGSRRAMAEALELVAEIIRPGVPSHELDWWNLRFAETAAIRAKLIERGYAPSYSSKILCALRGVLKASWRLGLMDSEQYHRAVDLEPVRGSRVVAGREAEALELRKLFLSCRQDEKHLRGLRDACLLSLAYGAGLRRNEIACLSIDDFDDERRELRVIGKGNAERIIPLPAWAVENIRGWIRVRGVEPGALIVPLSGYDDRILPSREHVSPQSIYMSLSQRVRFAGVSNLTPHDFRRSLATELLERSGDLVAVQKVLGHASPATTEKYLRQTERQKKRAMASLPDPEL